LTLILNRGKIVETLLIKGFKMKIQLKQFTEKKTPFTVLAGVLLGVLTGSLLGAGILIGVLPHLQTSYLHNVPLSGDQLEGKEPDSADKIESLNNLAFMGGNCLLPVSPPPASNLKIARKINAVVTAYSSSVEQTDDTPFITAAGTSVRNGIVANNYFPFGTKIRIPQLFGDEVFVVEDRMHWTKGNNHIDIWFPEYEEALNFGAKITEIEILAN
jgi:3D (Asp-Asp-Asp) domain-containing protein